MSDSIPSAQNRKAGFTLVELLVVIGIIALLISMLLPALNRARQQAVVIDCQSRMRTIGQAIHLYASQNKGMLPASKFESPGWNESWLPETLSIALGAKYPVDFITNINPIFVDRDIQHFSATWFPARNHYNFNLRLFPDIANFPDQWSYATNVKLSTLPITKVKRSSEIVAGWDGFQLSGYQGNAYHNSQELVDNADGYLWWATKGMDSQRTDTPGLYDRPIVQTKLSRAGSVTFRHMQRKAANALYLDGHVETKKEGELRTKDFCIPWRTVAPAR